MVKKLTRLGNSSALILDRPILELLEIDSDSPLKLHVEGRRLIVEPLTEAEKKKHFAEVVVRTGRKNSALFKRLAK